MEIDQKKYKPIETDNREPDIVMLWQGKGKHSNVIQIERNKIPVVIEYLKNQIKK